MLGPPQNDICDRRHRATGVDVNSRQQCLQRRQYGCERACHSIQQMQACGSAQSEGFWQALATAELASMLTL